MSNGRLKAQYNRVRTSTALKGNDMWNNTIGVDEIAGGNTAIEATLRAPEQRGHGPASGRHARQQAAQELIEASGFTAGVSNYEELLALARTRGNIGNQTSRGACKICGGLGHLTKQCHNFISGHTANGDLSIGTVAAAADAAVLGGPGASGLPGGLLGPEMPDNLSDISGLTSSSSSDGSDSDSSGSSERRHKRKKSDSTAARHKSGKAKHGKHKKKSSSSDQKHKRKSSHKKSSKHKKSRKE